MSPCKGMLCATPHACEPFCAGGISLSVAKGNTMQSKWTRWLARFAAAASLGGFFWLAFAGVEAAQTSSSSTDQSQPPSNASSSTRSSNQPGAYQSGQSNLQQPGTNRSGANQNQ